MTTSMTTHSLFHVPHRGARNPGRTANVTTPGSFANAHDVGGPLMFSSPDTPGMPAPSTKTAWDFLPEGWSVATLSTASTLDASMPPASMPSSISTKGPRKRYTLRQRHPPAKGPPARDP
jgi:hypothetical protein